jgi:alpha-glucosidase
MTSRHDRPTPSAFSWWRNAVVYQVYLRSFADGNADGIGDITGLRSRLEYLRDLGVDALWVNPWYVSPLNDGGYDVADYRQINPEFGTLDDAVALMAEANEMGLRVLADLVPNHTSSEHRWFQEALAGSPGSEARARYHFRPGRGVDGSGPPTNWTSVFGGSAWSRVPDGEWYLHLFDRTQPDLNWDNAEVRAEFRDILRFWLDLGAAGFRVDVAHGLAKDPTYPDLERAERRCTTWLGNGERSSTNTRAR